DDFADHVFGVFLLNDWSSRDLQAWEYVPLGPFLGKSFATSISPWIVPVAALETARVEQPVQDPEPLPYLKGTQPWGLDLHLEVSLNGHVIANPPFDQMYWTAAQQLAHMTVNGTSLRTGDMYASGTVSGPEPGLRGCLLELTWSGKEPIKLPDGTERAFLEDGDEVTITATAPGPHNTRIDFGAVTGKILPARRTTRPAPCAPPRNARGRPHIQSHPALYAQREQRRSAPRADLPRQIPCVRTKEGVCAQLLPVNTARTSTPSRCRTCPNPKCFPALSWSRYAQQG